MLDLSTPTRALQARASGRRGRALQAPLALALAAATLSPAGAAAAAMTPAPAAAMTPAPAHCADAGTRRITCQTFPRDAPVQGRSGRTIGTASRGEHPVACQRTGAIVRLDGRRSNVWVVTRADTGRWGWVNTVYVREGDNGRFARVARCPRAIGKPPATKRDGTSTGSRPSPGAPAEPGLPVEPGLPAEPGVPVDPGAPTEPGVPADPGAPTEPGVPAEPVAPTPPGGSTQPAGPAAPGAPGAHRPCRPGDWRGPGDWKGSGGKGSSDWMAHCRPKVKKTRPAPPAAQKPRPTPPAAQKPRPTPPTVQKTRPKHPRVMKTRH